MGKSAPSAPAPDPQIGKAALMQAETGEKWLAFSRDAFAQSNTRQAELDALTKDISRRQMTLAQDNQALARQVTQQQMGLADEQARYAREDRERYNTVFKPIEDQFIERARTYDSPARQAAAAAEARADVQSAAAQQRESAQREAASMGLDPSSGRFQGLNRSQDLGTALASAGAQNTARERVRATGLALQADVANMGRGLPAQSSQAAALGLQAGSSAASTSGAAATTGINTMGLGLGAAQTNQGLFNSATGIMNSGFGGAMRGYAGQADALNRQYQTQVDAWKTSQMIAAQSASGFGSAIGGLLGFAFRSDENAKEKKKRLPEGSALEAVRESPAEEWTYKEGVADGGRHVGPYAQDFQAATGLGDGRSIAAQDMLGLHHAAIIDLDRKVDALATRAGLAASGGRDRRGTEQPGLGLVIAVERPSRGKRVEKQEAA